MRLLSDRIEEFINWLTINTEYGEWDKSVQDEVHKKLIVCMISDPPVNKENNAEEQTDRPGTGAIGE